MRVSEKAAPESSNSRHEQGDMQGRIVATMVDPTPHLGDRCRSTISDTTQHESFPNNIALIAFFVN